MQNINNYNENSIPFQMQAAAWLIEPNKSNKTMRSEKERLKNYNFEPPEGKFIIRWIEKLYALTFEMSTLQTIHNRTFRRM